jgi:anthranilate phosphoribosyltransferase
LGGQRALKARRGVRRWRRPDFRRRSRSSTPRLKPPGPDCERAIQVNSVEESTQMILAVLENQPGPALNIVLLNAGAALYVAGVAKTLEIGIERASKAIAKGKARQKLDDFDAFTRRYATKA